MSENGMREAKLKRLDGKVRRSELEEEDVKEFKRRKTRKRESDRVIESEKQGRTEAA